DQAIRARSGSVWSKAGRVMVASRTQDERGTEVIECGALVAREVGHRPGQAEYAVDAAQAEPALVEPALEQAQALRGGLLRVAPQPRARHLAVQPPRRAGEPGGLAPPGGEHPGGDDGCGLDRPGRLRPAQVADGHADVDPVEQRAREPALVAAAGERRARAADALAAA